MHFAVSGVGLCVPLEVRCLVPDKMDMKDKGKGGLNNDFKVRRRLLKASAAAPLIATLSPNTALAQGSLTCANKGLEDRVLQGETALDFKDYAVSATKDNAVRELGTCWVKENGKTVWEVPKGSGNYIPDGNFSVPGNMPDNYTGTDCYFLRFFNVLGDGSVQTLGTYPQPATGDVLAGSCWTSIAVDGQFTINN